jgi:hypothetical protein
MQLPVELLLMICHLLSPDDRKSLSHTCRAMFAFTNTKTPFRKLKLTKSATSELSSLYRHSRLLAFADQVEWNPQPEQRRGRHHSTSGWTLVGLSIRIVLNALQTSSSLRVFEIHRLKVCSSHQRIILSVPTLRELVLNQSIFVQSTAKMPPPSITALTFVPGASQPAPTAHILSLLSESLEVLDVGYSPRTVYSTLLTMQFPRLVSLRHRSQELNTLAVLTSHLSITKLYISVPISHQQLNFTGDVLPRLRDLSSPWWVGEQLVPGRPVQVFADTGRKSVNLDDLEAKLVQLARSTSHIEALQMSVTRISAIRIFLMLAKRLPRLKRLQIWTPNVKLRVSPETGKGPKWNPLKKCPPAITEIEIRFRRPTKGTLPSQISRPFCHWMLYLAARACPALKVAIFAVLDSKESDVEQRDIPPVWKFKVCETRGEWEEQRDRLVLAASEEEAALEDSLRKIVSKTTLFACE